MRNLNINLIPHTVFLLCGPTGSGKSVFAEDIGYLCEEKFLTFELISSDACRKAVKTTSSLLNDINSDRYSEVMAAASEAAFKLVMTKLKIAVSYPQNVEVVVVDSTALNEDFRKEVASIAHEHGYKVVLVTFDYKTRRDYDSPSTNKNKDVIIDRSVKRFRTNVLPNLNATYIDEKVRIRSKGEFGVDIKDDSGELPDNWVDLFLSPKSNTAIEKYLACFDLDLKALSTHEIFKSQDEVYFAVIGDSHECVDELKELISLIEASYSPCIIIHIGDYLDKNNQTADMVNFIHERMTKGDEFIQGNHEAYVYRRLKGEIKPDLELEKSYFTSIPVLEGNEELRQKFFAVFEKSLPFAVLGNYSAEGNLPAVVTHAPCSNKHITKIHFESEREQRNYRVKNRSQPLEDELRWFFEEASFSHPLHIVGHIAHAPSDWNTGLKYKNKIFLDTGAVYGNKLTASILKEGKLVKFLSVNSKKQYCPLKEGESLPTSLTTGPSKQFKEDDFDLSSTDLRLLSQIETNDIRYISGTMAPANSTSVDIESLEEGLNQFTKLGIQKVILQPKFMGSRCQVYLFQNEPEKSFGVSRSGWKIRRINGVSDVDTFFASLYPVYEHLFQTLGSNKIILDGELLPWAALGRTLIDHNFKEYSLLVENLLTTLSSDEGFKNLGEFSDKFDVQGRIAALQNFNKTLEIYAKEESPTFRPFDVLYPKTLSNDLGFNEDLPSLTLDLSVSDSVTLAKNYFEGLVVNHGMEGVVIKPLNKSDSSKLPYLKVRNKEYLRLVYGYDYQIEPRYSRLCRQKNTNRKRQISVSEANLADAMLSAETVQKRRQIAIKLIGEMKQEVGLDPRL